MRDDRLLGIFAQVVPQVPAVGDLGRGRGSGGGAPGVGAGPVPADHLRAGMGLQPCLQRARLAVRQQVDHAARFGVGDHGAIHLPLAQREIIDPGDLRRGVGRRVRQRHDQPQHGGGMGRHAQGGGQPGAGPPGQLHPQAGQHAQQRHAAPPVPDGQPFGLLGERDLRAARIRAAEPAHRQDDQYGAAAGRAIGHHPAVPAMHLRGHRPARRAPRLRGPAARPQHHRLPGIGHPVDPQPGKMREQHEQQLLALPGNLQDTAGGGGRPPGRHGRLRRQRGSRAREVLADSRVLPEPRCHITPTRRARTRSSHQTPAATPAKPHPAPHPPSPITKIAQEPETPDPVRSNALEVRFQDATPAT